MLKKISFIMMAFAMSVMLFAGLKENTQVVSAATYTSATGETVTVPDDIFLKQATSYTCTLSCASNFLRRRAYQDGLDYSSITESSIKNVAWVSGGLKNSFKYASGNYNMKVASTCLYSMKTHGYTKNSATGARSVMTKLKTYIDKYGAVAVYCYRVSRTKTYWQHCVVICGYSGDTFYAYDPASSYSRNGICDLKNSYLGRKAGSVSELFRYSTKIWYCSKDSNIKPAAADTTEGGKTISVNFESGHGMSGVLPYKRIFSIRGTITSSYTITQVVCNVISSNGTVIQSSVDYPNATACQIRPMACNQSICVQKIPRGQYIYRLIVTDTSGSKTFDSSFTIR